MATILQRHGDLVESTPPCYPVGQGADVVAHETVAIDGRFFLGSDSLLYSLLK